MTFSAKDLQLADYPLMLSIQRISSHVWSANIQTWFIVSQRQQGLDVLHTMYFNSVQMPINPESLCARICHKTQNF